MNISNNIYQLPVNDNSIFNYKLKINTSSYIAEPQIKYGFYSFF